MKNQEDIISDIASEALRKWGLIKYTGATDEHLLELFRMVAREAAEKIETNSAWLIECGDGHPPTTYWTGKGIDAWSLRVDDAMRFERREDAERALHWIVPPRHNTHSAEHVWL
jgi:hypothetical protein